MSTQVTNKEELPMLTKNPFLIWLAGMMEKLKPADLEFGKEVGPDERVLHTVSPETLRIMAVSNQLIDTVNAKRRTITQRVREEHLSQSHPEIVALIDEQYDLNRRADRVMDLFWATVGMEVIVPKDAAGIVCRRNGAIVVMTEEEAEARNPFGGGIVVISGGMESLLFPRN